MRDDDVAVLVALPARPRADLAVAGLVDLQQVMRFGNDFAAGRIIGCRHEFAELFDVRVRMLEQMQTRSEEHTSELQSLMRISYAVFCLKKNTIKNYTNT